MNIIYVYVVVIIVLLYVVYYISTRKSAREYYNKSNGTFDSAAKTALKMTSNDNSPAGRVTHARILTNNILHDDNYRNQVNHNEILNAAATDYYVVLNQILGGEYNAPMELMLNIGDFNDTYHPAGDFGDIFMRADNATVEKSVAARKEVAQQKTTTADAMDKFFETSIQYTEDPQNVHDSGVIGDLNKTLLRLRSYGGEDSKVAIEEARKFINTKYSKDPLNENKVKSALIALDKVAEGNYIESYNDSEDKIFSYVWGRSKHNDNKDQADIVKEAIIDSLASAVENGSLVCIGGRTARVLNSLATIDTDDTISNAAMTQEAYRNQIFTETRNIISSRIEAAKNSDNEEYANVGKLYSGENVKINPGVEREFIDDIKKEIDINLEQYNTKLKPNELTKIRSECYAGIDFN